MSFRLTVSGFDLDKMLSLLGSRDPQVVRAIAHTYHGEAAERDDFVEALEEAVEQGTPLHNVQQERVWHADLARELSHYEQEHFLPGDYRNGIKHLLFYRFLDLNRSRLGHLGRALVGYLVHGRPLFGERIFPERTYGYLTRAEANDLCAILTELVEKDPSLLADHPELVGELTRDLTEFLGEITARRHDVWFAVS